MSRRFILTGLIALLGAASPQAAAAQSPALPRIEIGGQAGVLAVVGGSEGAFLLTTGPSLSIAASRLWRVELATEAISPTDSDDLTGLYQLRVGLVAREGRGARATWLVNAGLAGFFEYDRRPEYRRERPDGSVAVSHAHSTGRIRRPEGAVVGFAVQRPIARRAAVRWDVQGIMMRSGGVLKTSVGVSFPLGGRYVR